MKYLVSALQLGKLIEASKKARREEIVERIMDIQYVRGTSDQDTLADCILINKGRKPIKTESEVKKEKKPFGGLDMEYINELKKDPVKWEKFLKKGNTLNKLIKILKS